MSSSVTTAALALMIIDQTIADLDAGAELRTIAAGVESILADLDALAKQVRPESLDLLRSVTDGLDHVLTIIGTQDGTAIDALFDARIRAAIRTPLALARLSLGMMRPATGD